MEFQFDTKFQHPYTMLIAGSSGSGKTYFTKNMLNQRVEPDFVKIYWFYSEWQDGYNDMPANVQLIPGMPSSLDTYINEESGPKAIIFDDLMNECVDNVLIQSAFTKKRHHNNVSVILLLQNLFCQGKMMRTIHLNTEYVEVFGNARDKSQFHHFCRQVEPNNSRNLMNAYIDATSKPYAHFLVDLKPLTPNILRYRSNSLSSDEQIVYLVNGM